MVPEISVTVLAFRLCLVAAEPNWNIALRLSLTLAGSYSVSSALAAKPHAITMAKIAIARNRRIGSPFSLKRLILHLRKALLRVARAHSGRLLVPVGRHRRIG